MDDILKAHGFKCQEMQVDNKQITLLDDTF